MIKDKWLVCGTQTKNNYKDLVWKELDRLVENNKDLEGESYYPICIIEGCCPDSADTYAEEWAKKHNVPIQHHPATSGNYLRRNIEMVGKADFVIAFWNNFSYGTAHTIAHATKKGIFVEVINIK